MQTDEDDDFEVASKNRDTIFYMRGPWESEQKPRRQKEVWGKI